MIRGVVNASHEAIVRIRVRGPGHSGLNVDVIVDSGFNGSLALPAATIAALGLAPRSGGRAVLADGSVIQLNTYAAELSWDGVWIPVILLVVGDEALLGMELLSGHELRIAVVPGGSVEITRLP
jgi:clan AA aspartic protease